MAKCNDWPTEYSAKWKRWPNAMMITWPFERRISLFLHLATFFTWPLIAFDHLKDEFSIFALRHWLQLAIKIKISSFIHLAILKTNFTIFALSHFFHLADIWCLKIALGLHFHLANHCTWTLSLGTLFLLDRNILLAKFCPKEFFGPKERCGQEIRQAKRNDT